MADKSKQTQALQKDRFAVPLSSLEAVGLTPTKDNTAKNKEPDIFYEGEIVNHLGELTRMMSDIKSIRRVMPEINLYSSILVPTILSPKDLSNPPLKIGLDTGTWEKDGKDAPLLKIEAILKSKYYKLEDKLPIILEEVLIDYGAYINIFLPPDAIDAITQLSGRLTVENYKTILSTEVSRNIIGDVDTKTEAALNKMALSLTDDFELLHRPEIRRIQRESIVSNLTYEAFGTGKAAQKSTEITNAEVLRLRASLLKGETKDKRQMKPIMLKVPVDAILPVGSPTDPSDHIMYIALIDPSTGAPISTSKEVDYVQALRNRLRAIQEQALNPGSGASANGQVLNKDVAMLTTMGLIRDKQIIGGVDITEAYKARVKGLVKDGISNGIVSGDIQLPDAPEIYECMLYRALQGLKTKLLVLPPEYVSYIAIDYNSTGRGEGLIEANLLWISFAATHKMAKLNAEIHNAIPEDILEINVDNADKNPLGTITKAVAKAAHARALRLPTASANPVDIFDHLSKAGFRLKINGGERFPSTIVDQQSQQRNITVPTTEMEESLKKTMSLGFTIPPELVDQALQGQFATGLRNSYQLFTRSCMLKQQLFINSVSQQFIQKACRLDQELYNLCNDYAKDDVDKFIDSLYIRLANTDFTMAENVTQTIQTQFEAIDKIVEETSISDMLVRGIVGADAIGQNGDTLRAIIAAEAKRRWLIEENIMPNVAAIMVGDAGDELSKGIIQHHDEMFKILEPIFKKLKEGADALNKITNTEGADAGFGGGDDPFATPPDGGTGEDLGDGTEDGGDTPSEPTEEEVPAEQTPPEEETPNTDNT